MADLSEVGTEPRRERSRRKLRIDEEDIVKRVIKFYEDDDTARGAEKDRRIQRYAKYRMWTEAKDWPFEHASNLPLPDMTEKSLRVQDTLANAVMSTRPTINAKATEGRHKNKEDNVDHLIDHQVFVEQDGESVIGDMAEAFVNDGVITVFVPWVTETREAADARKFPAIPPDMTPLAYFSALLRNHFPGPGAIPRGDGWDWDLGDKDEAFQVKFYTLKDGQVEMIVLRDVVVYDGPKLILKEWDEVLYPSRAQNLHIPGPSNPKGASHVILVSPPTVDEIKRLWKQGVYDRLDAKKVEALEVAAQDHSNEEMKAQKDALQGVTAPDDGGKPKVASHRNLTMLMCFDSFDIDQDGIDEDVVWWVILETKTLCRMARLGEVFPSRIPRRPLAGGSFLPVGGRYAGMSLLEVLEGLHDGMVATLNITVDAGVLTNVPFFFYRSQGGMKEEVIRLAPGEGYPLADPKRDVEFPNLGNRDQTFGINMVTMLSQMQDKVSTIGGLQQGQVPQGKSSALRTVGGMAMILGQGEARPERLLRRFFNILSDVWKLCHEGNLHFMPPRKKIRIMGLKSRNEDPYRELTPGDVDGVFNFSFKANVFNTSKQAMQESLERLLGVYVSELAITLGITRPEGFYRLLRDFGLAMGQDPDDYITEPIPGSLRPRLMAEEAIAIIFDGQIPEGEPEEAGGAVEHLQKLGELVQDEQQFGLFTAPMVEILRNYMQQVSQKAALQQRQQAAAQAAGQFQGGQGGAPPGRPPEQLPQDPQAGAPVQPGELIDESLPGAGGGANVGVA